MLSSILQHCTKNEVFQQRFFYPLASEESGYGSSTLREKCPYSEFFRSAFSCIRTEYGMILRICLYSVQMQENADQ